MTDEHTLTESQKEELTKIQNSPEDLRNFIAYHQGQLKSFDFPQTHALFSSLHEKLKSGTYDGGEYFQIMEDPDNSTFRLMATQPLTQNQDVFLVDHSFTFRFKDLRIKLAEKETLRTRLTDMLKFWKEKDTLRDATISSANRSNYSHLVAEYEDMEIVEPFDAILSKPCDLENIETLSFYNNNIKNFDTIVDILHKCPKLKAIWLNENPLSDTVEKRFLTHKFIEENFSNIEIMNSNFTQHAGEWAIKYATFSGDLGLMAEIPLEEMKSLNLSDRQFLNMKDYKVFERCASVEKITAMGTGFDTFGEANEFMKLIRDMKSLKGLDIDPYYLDMFFDITKKLKELNPNIRYLNSYDIGYSKPTDTDQEID